jgi:hypothetical protein
MPDAEVVELLRRAYEHNGPRQAAVTLLDLHGFWLSRAEIRRYLVYVNIEPPGIPPETFPEVAVEGQPGGLFAYPRRRRYPHIELDWRAVEDDRRRSVFESIGDQQDQMILNAALSLAVGRVGQLAKHFNAYTAALFAGAVLDVTSVSEAGRKAQVLLVGFGRQRQKPRDELPSRYGNYR